MEKSYIVETCPLIGYRVESMCNLVFWSWKKLNGLTKAEVEQEDYLASTGLLIRGGLKRRDTCLNQSFDQRGS